MYAPTVGTSYYHAITDALRRAGVSCAFAMSRPFAQQTAMDIALFGILPALV